MNAKHNCARNFRFRRQGPQAYHARVISFSPIMNARATFSWSDPFLLDAQLTDDERQVRDAARAYSQDRLLPRVQEAFRHEKTDASIFREMGELGLLGPTIPEQYGGAGLNYVCYGVVAREVERVDSGYR